MIPHKSILIKLTGSIAALLFAALLILPGCDEKKTQVKAAGIQKEYKAGDCRLLVEVSAGTLTVAQTLQLKLQAVCPEGWQMEFPDLKDTLGEFTIDKSIVGDPALSADGRQISRTLTATLVPFLAGDYTIPEQVVRFTPGTASSASGAKTAQQAESVKTEPLKISVTPVIPAGEQSPALRDITPPMSLPTNLHGWIAGASGAALLLGLLTGWLLWRRRSNGTPEIILTPQEIALRDLQALLEQKLVASGLVKEFYLGLSDILRHYIENRFSLAAPERTTEEFLEELRSQPVLNEKHTQLLKEFLKDCDMVKFARHTPVRTEIDASVQSCRNFIEETPPEPESVTS